MIGLKKTVLFLLCLLLTACDTTTVIVHGLNEQDADEIAVLLEREHIPAFKIAENIARGPAGSNQPLWDIAVHGQDRVAAMAILSANGLPRRYSPTLLDLFPASTLVPSDTTEKIRYEAGLAASIAETIRKIDGVVDANVIISFPDAESKKPITATVFVKHTGILDDPNSHIVSKIKQLVSSSVAGLTYANVTVVPDRSMLSLPTPQYALGPSRESIEVWGFVLAESSLGYFQMFFAVSFIVILILGLSIVWFLWKLHPILKKSGGFLALVRFTPIKEQEDE